MRRASFDTGKDDVRSVWGACRGAGVHARLGNALEETLLQFVAQCGDALRVFRERLAGNFRGLAESDDAGDVLRPGTETALVMSAI